MSAHADKTLHRKIYNINDTDAFSPYPFFKNVILAHEFICEFVKEFLANLSTKFVRIRANSYDFCTKNWLCYEWPVLYMHIHS